MLWVERGRSTRVSIRFAFEGELTGTTLKRSLGLPGWLTRPFHRNPFMNVHYHLAGLAEFLADTVKIGQCARLELTRT